MSLESAKAFIDRMKTDTQFAKKVAECTDDAARQALVQGAGYSFTPEEIRSVAGGLGDDVLAAVVGGTDSLRNGISVELYKDQRIMS